MAEETTPDFNEDENLGKAYDSMLMRRLLSYAKPYWKFFAIAILLLLATTLADLSGPFLMKTAIDDHINGYTKPMVAYDLSSKKEGVAFRGKIYVRLKDIPSQPQPDIYSMVYVNSKAYLVKGFINSNGRTDGTLIKEEDNTFRYKTEKESLSAVELTATETKAFRSQDIQKVSLIGLIYIGIILLGLGLNVLQIYILSYTGQAIIFNLRQKVFSHIQKMPLGFFDKNPVGRLVTRVTNDTETLNEMYTSVLVNLLKDISILVGISIIMLQMNVKLALVVLSVLPLITLATAVFRIKARTVYRKVRVALARINASFSENISGMRVIQIFNKEKENFKTFSKINHDYYKAGMREIVVFGIFRPLIDTLAALCMAALLWFAGGDVIRGSLQFGVMFAFINYINVFFQPINDISEKYNILQSAMASSERIFMILDTPVEEDNGTLTLEKAHFKGDIEFKNVSFAYHNEEWVLRDVSFKVPQGKTIAIVGATGAGKTSIINLINRFYEIQKGEILIDGINLNGIKKDSLRQNIAVVLQDVFLFSGTVKDNIKLNNDAITMEDIKRVSRYVNAERFIDNLPSGYEEEVKERGITFSSGQRQLLAFARALAFDPSILILDEATANIDTETELLIQDALEKITKGRTTIVIAHRLSTIQHADNIIVLHKGRIREMGNHQKLLEKKGMYYNLYNLQYKGNEM